MITLLYASMLTILLVVLLVRVARRRWKYKIGIGDGGNHDLTLAMRVHGNFIETTPWLLILLLLMELSHVPAPLLHGYGLAIVLGRGLHAWGLAHYAGASFGRMAGMILTITAMLVGAAVCMWYGLS